MNSMMLFVIIAYSVAVILGFILTILYCKYSYKIDREFLSYSATNIDVAKIDTSMEEQMLQSALKYFKIVNR